MNEDAFADAQATLPEGRFLAFVQHESVPVPLPVAGLASHTYFVAQMRAEEMLKLPIYTHAWVVSRDEVTEVVVPTH